MCLQLGALDRGALRRRANIDRRIQAGVAPIWQHISEDGRPAVLLNIDEQPNVNAVRIDREISAILATLRLPPSVRLVCWYDQSELVTQSVGSVRDAVLIGMGLEGLALLFFLRSWRVTLVAAIAVPATLAATVVVLSLLGMSFNIMSLGGIAAAVGLLIDDAIVMIEHIVRRAATGGDDAVLPAAREFLKLLTGSSLATLIAFLPLSFLTGVTGAFSKALSVTTASALALSWATNAFVVLLLARRLVDFSCWRDPGSSQEGWLDQRHARLLQRLGAKPRLLVPIGVALLAIGYVAYARVPTGFMRKVDESGFVMDYSTRPGTSLIETEREMAQVDALLHANDQALTFCRRLGTGLGGDLGQSYHGDYLVRLRSDHSKLTEEVMSDVLAQIGERVPGWRSSSRSSWRT